jgi:hypothetical protein
MRFAHILDVVEHTQSTADALESGECPVRLLVKCELFDSIAPPSARAAVGTLLQQQLLQQQQQPMPMLDEDGLIVMYAKPLELCPGVSMHMVPAEQLSPFRLCVVPHMLRADLWVVLTRQPLDMFMAEVGFPLPG